ncbi:MAG: hypothetical protein WAN04_08875, partial [Candidatus Udaeobacter sp.]
PWQDASIRDLGVEFGNDIVEASMLDEAQDANDLGDPVPGLLRCDEDVIGKCRLVAIGDDAADDHALVDAEDAMLEPKDVKQRGDVVLPVGSRHR